VNDKLVTLDDALQQIDQWIAGLQTLREFITTMKTQDSEDTSVRLAVPWLSQLAATAGYAGGDCGMACVAMILNMHGPRVTVDEVSRKSGLKPGFTGAAWWDVQRTAALLGLTLAHSFNLELNDLETVLRAGQPAIVILNYQSIPARFRYSTTYNSGHFVVVVGIDQEAVFVHDPYWPEGSKSGTSVALPRADFLNAWSTLAPGNTLSRQALMVRP
jgi:ABC-type bacteriocin/lantibiotic exporter with double-glycine peptidase domain